MPAGFNTLTAKVVGPEVQRCPSARILLTANEPFVAARTVETVLRALSGQPSDASAPIAPALPKSELCTSGA
jgi:hypothetical protein